MKLDTIFSTWHQPVRVGRPQPVRVDRPDRVEVRAFFSTLSAALQSDRSQWINLKL